jgi:hypothetical protein
LIYIVPSDPSSPVLSFAALRKRARRAGFRIVTDRYTGTFTLIDARLGLPIGELEHVSLVTVANAVEAARSSK